MLSRRELIAAGMASGLTSDETAGAAPATQPGEAEALREISQKLDDIESTLSEGMLSNRVVYGLAAKVRAQMEAFFKTNQKFPDFIDVGIAVFHDVFDWHVKNRQQVNLTRGPDSRYWLQFMFTTLIVRAEYAENYIGIPYDKA
jgi:hypothetical protein